MKKNGCDTSGFSNARGTIAGHVAVGFAGVDVDDIPFLEHVNFFLLHLFPKVHNIDQCYVAALVDVTFVAAVSHIQEAMQVRFLDNTWPKILAPHLGSQDCHNVQPRSVLRDAVVGCVQHLRVHTVGQSS